MGNCCFCCKRKGYNSIEQISERIGPPSESIEISNSFSFTQSETRSKSASTARPVGQKYDWELELYVMTQHSKRSEQVQRQIAESSITYFFKQIGIVVSEVKSSATDDNYVRFRGSGVFILTDMPVYQLDYEREIRTIENEQLEDSLHPNNIDIDWALRITPASSYEKYEITYIYTEVLYKAFKQAYRFKIKKYTIEENKTLSPATPYFYWYGKGCLA